jgi:hypothetical protein
MAPKNPNSQQMFFLGVFPSTGSGKVFSFIATTIKSWTAAQNNCVIAVLDTAIFKMV